MFFLVFLVFGVILGWFNYFVFGVRTVWKVLVVGFMGENVYS